jgi:ATP-dependent RNA helicase DeaD
VGRAGREGTAITLAEPRERRQLENIERLTKQTITVAKVPSVADLRSRQIELTVAQVRESLASPDLEDYNSILHALSGDDSDRNIALAAIKIVHAERGALMDEREIPDASERFRNDGKKGDRKNYEGKSYDGKAYDGKKKFDKGGKFDKGAKGGKFDKHGGKGDRSERGAKPQSNGDTEFVYVSLGRNGGIRPGDLVGAIANETGLSGREIGPIRITDNFSVVGVPAGSVDSVVSTMGTTTMRGKKAKVRRYTE